MYVLDKNIRQLGIFLQTPVFFSIQKWDLRGYTFHGHVFLKGIFADMSLKEGLDGGSWYSLITKNLAIYSLSLKFWLIH